MADASRVPSALAGVGEMDASRARRVAVLRGRVRTLSVGFFLTFVAFSSGQLLQTSINGSAGYVCVMLIYIPFGVAALVSPLVVGTYGPTRSLPLAAAGYVIFVASNVLGDVRALLPGCAIVGVAAAILWSSQGTYLGRAASAMAAASGRPMTECTSDLNGSFFAIFMSSGGVSSVLASAIMVAGGGAAGLASSVRALFVLLTCVGIAGVLVLATLAEADSESDEVVVPLRWPVRTGRRKALGGQVDGGGGEGGAAEAAEWDASVLAGGRAAIDVRVAASVSGTDAGGGGAAAEAAAPPVLEYAGGAEKGGGVPASLPSPPSVYAMLRFLATERRFHLLAPAIAFSGAGQGFVMGAWIAVSVASAPGLGTQWVGLVGAAYSFTTALGIMGWRRVAAVPAYGRTAAFVATCALQFVWYLAMAAWLSYTRLGQAAEVQAASPLPVAATTTVTVLAVLLYGSVDSVWNGFLPATLQVFYPARHDTPCAMAAIRVAYSAGFAIQSAVSLALGPARLPEQCLLLAAFLAVSSGALVHLHRSVMSLDGQARRG